MSYTMHVVPLAAFNFGGVPWDASIPKYPWNWWGGSDTQLNPDGENWNANGPWNDFTIDSSRAFEIEVEDIDSSPDVLDPGTYHAEGPGLQTLQTPLPGAPAGANIVNEYEVTLTGSDGEAYTLVALNVVPVGTSDPGQSWTGTLIGFTFDGAWPPEGVTLDYVQNSNVGEPSLSSSDMLPVCYLQGTKILTDAGEVSVEDLRENDMAVCRFGGLRPVRWMGRQRFAGSRAAGQEAIRFAPGSIADNMPREALFVSPGHSMLVVGILVLAADLVNGITITREAARDVWSYFQIDLGEHDLVLANGTWSESFADCGDIRAKFDNVAEFRRRFPDHVAPEMPALCADRPKGGEMLHAALRHTAGLALNSAAPVAPGRLEGRIEGVAAPRHVSGWAMDADHRGRPILLEVVLHGEVIGTTLACAPWKEAAYQGRMGFVFNGERRLTTHELLRLVVRRAQDGQTIAALPSGALGAMQGHLDLVTASCRLEGWARDMAAPQQPVMLEVVLGDEVIGTVLACRPRQDLAKSGLGDVGFVFEAKQDLTPAEMETIQLRRINDRAVLRRSDKTRVVSVGAVTANVA